MQSEKAQNIQHRKLKNVSFDNVNQDSQTPIQVKFFCFILSYVYLREKYNGREKVIG